MYKMLQHVKMGTGLLIQYKYYNIRLSYIKMLYIII
jgi:hypothetical protein